MYSVQHLSLPNRRYALGVSIAWEGLKYFKYWILAAVALAFLGPLALAQTTDIDLSTWYYTGNIGKGFTAFVAGGFLYALLPCMIAAGLTRRELSVAMGICGLLWSAALGVLVFTGLLAERAYYHAMGWNQGIDTPGEPAPIGTLSETVAFASVYPLLFLAYFAVGSLIGAAAYRWNGTGWLLLIPVLPVVVSLDSAVYGTEPIGPEWTGGLGQFMDEWGRAAVLAVMAVVAVALAIAARRVLIDIPLQSKKG